MNPAPKSPRGWVAQLQQSPLVRFSNPGGRASSSPFGSDGEAVGQVPTSAITAALMCSGRVGHRSTSRAKSEVRAMFWAMPRVNSLDWPEIVGVLPWMCELLTGGS
jgi:hypothetical protein